MLYFWKKQTGLRRQSVVSDLPHLINSIYSFVHHRRLRQTAQERERERDREREREKEKMETENDTMWVTKNQRISV